MIRRPSVIMTCLPCLRTRNRAFSSARTACRCGDAGNFDPSADRDFDFSYVLIAGDLRNGLQILSDGVADII